MTHAHITAWVIGLILFFVARAMYSNRNGKAKMLHMIVRLLYILIIATGLMLYMNVSKYLTGNMHMWYGLKSLAGILVIGGMEMVLIRTRKGKSLAPVWLLLAVGFVAAVFLGLSLPQGFQIFHPFG
ncbi:YisL family protein [Ectobacillus ponti]|uniref:UPF0344 protein NK662_06815 n=1 Tax=Ectobacillus ponti TaxID=2961894 RepID=A0AA41X8D8_9BACI|nr:YisL family protein [Ectobacillus ponti]MCP8968250.1 YisL family protein [Ectobacillus ponti]